MKLPVSLLLVSMTSVAAFSYRSARPAGRHLSAFSTSSTNIGSRPATALRMSAESFAKEQISGNKVVVFSKSFCPFCKKTKKALDGLGVEYTTFELNQMDDGAEIQDALLAISGQKTVPNVFVNGEHLGGNDDTQKAIKEGKLQGMLGI
jgi:glutaredoxin 3